MRHLGLTFFALAALVAAPACGGEEGGDQAAGGSAQTIDVVGTDFAFDPSDIKVDKAGSVTFRLSNEGGTDHALEIEGSGVEEATEIIGAGETAELTIDLVEGEYEMYCPVDGHRELGMEGSVHVGAGMGGGTQTDETTTEKSDDDRGY
jgi:uncharacterized cupredoxin-like copper-binding protein